MTEPTAKRALVFYNDAGAQILAAVNAEEFPGLRAALHSYVDVVRDVLVRLCETREFQHITLTETSNPYQNAEVQSSLCLAIGTPKFGEDGELEGISNMQAPLDLSGLLTAKGDLLGVLKEKVAYDQEGVMVITDGALGKKVTGISKRIELGSRFQEALNEEGEELLVSALSSLEVERSGLTPVHPEDLLTLLSAYLYEAAGVTPPPPGLLSRGRGLISRMAGMGGGLVSKAQRRFKRLNKVVWRLEDIAVGGARLAAKVATKAIRPLLIGIVLRRVLQTLDSARTPEMRMGRMSRADSLDYYYSTLLGKDWNAQMEGDLLDAIQEVDEGYITDEYKDEKRKLAATMLRRLEVEEWDKERMKHFYYGSYGMGPWYFDMEERLHNPYFIENRGWTGPIEGWVGKNQAYPNDLPGVAPGADATAVLDMVEARQGKKLGAAARNRIAERELVSPGDSLLARSALLRGGIVDRKKLAAAKAAAAAASS